MLHLLMLPFTIAFSLLMLPFTLLRMAFGLFGISTHLLLFPLKIFARHTVLCLIIIAVLILYFALKKDPTAIDPLKQQLAAQKTEKHATATANGQPPVIEPVSKRENGDSSFATDLYAVMSKPERAKYSQHFYAAMASSADETAYPWNFYNIHGTLTPTDSFKNKVGDRCRNFTEVLKVHRIEQTLSGTACERASGGWCKLKPNATPACGLGHTPGMFDGIGRAVRNLF